MAKENNDPKKSVFHKFDTAERFLQHLKFSIRAGGTIPSYNAGSPDDVCLLVDVFRAGVSVLYDASDYFGKPKKDLQA